MRTTRLWKTGLFAAVAVLPAPAASQLASSLQARTEMLVPADGGGLRGWSSLGGSVALDRAHLALLAEASALTDGSSWHGRGSFGGSVMAPAIGPLQLSIGGSVFRAGPPHLTSHWASATQARASFRFGAWGAWTGIDARRTPAADSIGEGATPAIGGWRQLGSAVVSVSLAPRRFRVGGTASTLREVMHTDSVFNDTLGRWTTFQHPVTVGDSGRAARHLRWDQAEARVFWSRGRIAADATFGARIAGDFGSALWGTISGLYVLTPRIVLLAGAGSQPGEPGSAWERRSVATLGVRVLGPPEPAHRPPPEIRPGAADFRLEPRRDGRYTVSLRVPYARTVEISGDFTDWKPVALSRAGLDRWEAVVAIVPGTYYVNVRVNGDRWMAPPGVPEVEDEFNGTVGLLVVP
jgi:hypothetical protein